MLPALIPTFQSMLLLPHCYFCSCLLLLVYVYISVYLYHVYCVLSYCIYLLCVFVIHLSHTHTDVIVGLLINSAIYICVSVACAILGVENKGSLFETKTHFCFLLQLQSTNSYLNAFKKVKTQQYSKEYCLISNRNFILILILVGENK